jgi:hypothetical protein
MKDGKLDVSFNMLGSKEALYKVLIEDLKAHRRPGS